MDRIPARLALLLLLALLTAPFASVRASHGGGPLVSVVPSTVDGGLIPGDTFSITVNGDELGEFNSYDITMRYSTAVLTATSAAILQVQGQSFQQIIMVVDDGTGTVRVSAGLLASSVFVIDSTALFSVDFVVDDYGSSALDLVNDKIAMGGSLIGHNTQDGQVTTFTRPLPTNSELIHWKAKENVQHLDISKSAGLQSLFGFVRNSGTNPAAIKVVFIVSISGITDVVESNTVNLSPGQSTEVTGFLTVTVPGVYSVVAVPFNSSEGVVFFQGENSKSFTFKAVE